MVEGKVNGMCLEDSYLARPQGLPPTLKEGPPMPPLVSPTPAPSKGTQTPLCQAPSLDSTSSHTE